MIREIIRGLRKLGELKNALPVGNTQQSIGQYAQQWQALKSVEATRNQDLPCILVTVWSESVVDPELKCYNAHDETEELPNHPVNEIIQMPNEDMDWSDLQQIHITDNLLTGTTYLHKRRDNNDIVREFMPYSDANITPIQSNSPVMIGGELVDNSRKWISHYVWRNREGAEKIIPKRDIIMLPWIQRDPGFMQKGLSPMLSLTGQFGTDNEFTKLVYSLAYNGAYPGLIAAVSGDEVMNTDIEDIREAINAGLTGDNRGKTMVMKGNVTMARVQSAMADIAIALPRMITETRACANFRVPAIVAGLYTGLVSTRYAANTASVRLQFFTDTVCPKLNADARKLTRGLRDEYPGFPEFVLRYDYSKVDALHERTTQEQGMAIEARKEKILTLQETRAAFPVDNEPPAELVAEQNAKTPTMFSFAPQDTKKVKTNGAAKREPVPAIDENGNIVE